MRQYWPETLRAFNFDQVESWSIKIGPILRKLRRLTARGVRLESISLLPANIAEKALWERWDLFKKWFLAHFDIFWVPALHMNHSKDVCQYWPKSAHLVWADSLGFHYPSLTANIYCLCQKKCTFNFDFLWQGGGQKLCKYLWNSYRFSNEKIEHV